MNLKTKALKDYYKTKQEYINIIKDFIFKLENNFNYFKVNFTNTFNITTHFNYKYYKKYLFPLSDKWDNYIDQFLLMIFNKQCYDQEFKKLNNDYLIIFNDLELKKRHINQKINSYQFLKEYL